MSRVLDVDGPFGLFSRRLLSVELPELPPARRDDTVAFVCRRAAQTPGPLRAGLITITTGVGLAERLIDPERLTALLRATSLPLVGELPRMVRSLAFAYVWETWPATHPDGAPGTPETATTTPGTGTR